MKKEEPMSISAYARSRGLSPSTISRQCRDGYIKRRPDGKIDPASADRDREENLDPFERERQARRKAERKQNSKSDRPQRANRESIQQAYSRGVRDGTANAARQLLEATREHMPTALIDLDPFPTSPELIRERLACFCMVDELLRSWCHYVLHIKVPPLPPANFVNAFDPQNEQIARTFLARFEQRSNDTQATRLVDGIPVPQVNQTYLQDLAG